MRRIFTFALSALLVLSFCAFAYADAMLYRGQNSVGAVPSVDKNSQLCVSVEDLGRMFGFSAKRENDELSLSRGNALIRISLGATAGWYGYSIIPLRSAPFEDNGKFWIDTHSAAALFQGFSGRGVNNRLRFAKIAVQKPANDYGDFGDSDNTQTAGKSQPKKDLNAIINRTVTTNPYSQQTAKLPQSQTQSQPTQTQTPSQQAQIQTQTQQTQRPTQRQQNQTPTPVPPPARQTQPQPPRRENEYMPPVGQYAPDPGTIPDRPMPPVGQGNQN